MKRAKVLRGDGTTLVERCGVTETHAERATGLLKHAVLPPDEGLWFAGHSSIHTFFMRFPIDVAFVDRSGRIIALYHSLKPWRHTWIHPFALLGGGILEASAGLFHRAGLKEGEELRICLIS